MSKATCPFPFLRIIPNQAGGERVLYLSGDGKQTAVENPDVQQLLKQGHEIWALDLRGIGELRNRSSSKQLGDWKTFYLAYLLDQSLVGSRTEDVLNCARFMATDAERQSKPVRLIATGEACVTALHAKALEPELLGPLTLKDGIESWAKVCEDPNPDGQLPNTIHGVLEHYDLPDLKRLAE